MKGEIIEKAGIRNFTIYGNINYYVFDRIVTTQSHKNEGVLRIHPRSPSYNKLFHYFHKEDSCDFLENIYVTETTFVTSTSHKHTESLSQRRVNGSQIGGWVTRTPTNGHAKVSSAWSLGFTRHVSRVGVYLLVFTVRRVRVVSNEDLNPLLKRLPFENSRNSPMKSQSMGKTL